MRLKVNKQQIKLIHNKCSCLIDPKCTASVQSVTKKICIKEIQNQFNDLFFWDTMCHKTKTANQKSIFLDTLYLETP